MKRRIRRERARLENYTGRRWKGIQGAEFRELEGACEGVEGAADPDSDGRAMRWEGLRRCCRECDRCPNRDGIPTADRDAEADAEDLQGFPCLCIGRVGWRLGDCQELRLWAK